MNEEEWKNKIEERIHQLEGWQLEELHRKHNPEVFTSESTYNSRLPNLNIKDKVGNIDFEELYQRTKRANYVMLQIIILEFLLILAVIGFQVVVFIFTVIYG